MESVELYGFGDVDRSGKVRWVAHELGLTVEERRVGFGEHRQPPYTGMNPLAQIPTVRFRGRILTESTAICHTLAESFDTPKLWVGRGEPEREAYLYWLAVFGETFEGRLVECAVSRAGILGPEVFAIHERALRFKLGAIAPLLPSEGFLCGPTFTLADVLGGYSLRLAVQCELVDAALAMPYLDRCRVRPAAVASRIFASLG
ncbi:MAG: glutathione S-transferase family protein [Alphaproteobacteria bacterium]|nr:glutathione S-transferase family protein [Alphaproteobacteria bacterium]MCB9697552.1 glutathione S-transferase family protein [Alphaproteobacteria bacterium]